MYAVIQSNQTNHEPVENRWPMKRSLLLRKQKMLLKAVVMYCSWRETCKTRFTGQRETGKFEQDKHERLTCCVCEVNRLNCKLVDSRNTWHREKRPPQINGNDYIVKCATFKKARHTPLPSHIYFSWPSFASQEPITRAPALVYSLRYSNREPDGQPDIKESIKNFILPTTRSN